jgi:hypothetical protein
MVYDIETAPLQAWVWRCGDQYVGHNQLVKGARSNYDIICISWAFNDGVPARVLDWGYKEQNSKNLVERFDKIIKAEQDKGTIIFGKNNKKFDDKHVNTQRFLHGLAPMPDWVKYTEDLERQCRKITYLLCWDWAERLRCSYRIG